MPKNPKDTNFTVHLTLLGFWNQEMSSFLKMTLLVGVIYLGTLFMRRIIQDLPYQVTDWLSLTTPLRSNWVLNNQSLKFHKLLKMILEIKLLRSFQKLLSNQLNNMLLKKMLLQH